ncbi:DMT family transporter [Leptolyngbyaceae cyanobacterium CCMR0082]|uniref:DMT family transporter n=1 Tax=Adonisia turfae CCMR0082 TaxID=2304604 RepID=A0A6M0SD34_9CYAN|nr:DMT family transporter [Adonisia turfae]NEZ66390.1 DMT family transporter [Adonisia turfae CCMR0082]
MSYHAPALKTSILTSCTLIAFAANSLLTRMALGPGSIDAASFMTLRLVSGATMLLAVMTFSQGKSVVKLQGKWTAALMLFLYAVTFSFSYLQLAAGTGALILFGSVQVTMIVAALKQGEKPHPLEWAGLLLALMGLLYLVSPGLAAPPVVGSLLMVMAGVAWGFYSLLGRGSQDPVAYTTANFIRAVPFAVGVSLISLSEMHLTLTGVVLALLSGALASGVGYAMWYAALKGLTATRAATVQLAVPVIAALGGILFLQETLSARLVLASLLILGGIGLAVMGHSEQ